MEKKMTNAVALNYVLENCELPTEVREKIQNIYNSTTKKSASKKPSKTAEQNKALGEIVKEVLGKSAEPMTVTDIQNAEPRLSTANEISNQKVTAVIRMLIAEKEVIKVVEGKKSKFTLASAE